MQLVKKILLVIFIALSFFTSFGQGKPSGFPITKSNGWIEYGYLQNDSGRIDAFRDTLWTPRFIPTTVWWLNTGVDSAFWTYKKTTGQRWFKEGGGSGGGSTDTALIRTIVSDSLWTTNFYGKLYDSTTWNNLSSFTNNGGTFTVTGNKIVGSGGAGTFTQSLDWNYYTGLERWKAVAKVKATSGTGGFGLGIRSTASFIAVSACGYFNTSTGRLYMQLGAYSTSDSSSVLAFSTNDYIILTVEQNIDVITVTARNATTNSNPVSLSYTYTVDASTPISPHNSGKFAIFSIGGSFTVDSLAITSNETKNSILGFGGDSKLAGSYAGAFSGRVSDIAGTYFKSTVNVSGGGNLTSDILNQVPEIIALNPKQFILNIGRNDSTAGVSAATTYANYDTIAARLTRAGINVFHALPMYETVAGQGNLINHITSTFSADKIFDTYNPMKQPNALNPDGIHPNEVGNALVLNAILQKNVLAGANNVTTFRNGSGIINHGTHQDLGGTITTDANIVTNAHYGEYIFINGNRIDYDTSASKNNTYLLSANTNAGTHTTFAGNGAGGNQNGDYAIGIGENALSNNPGDNVVGVGVSAASGNTKDDVTAVGNFTGYLQTGDWFTGIGKSAGLSQTGNYVSVFGKNAGISNAGHNVTAGGLSALYQNTKDNATALGYLNGYGNTGEHYTGLGSNTSINNSYDYVTLIGVNASATASQQLVFKNGAYNWRLYHGSLTANRLDTIPDYSGVLVVSNGYGTAGQRLKSNGAGVAPTWVDTASGTNLGNSDLTQSSGTRQYTIGYNSAAGQRYLSLGKLDYSERTFMLFGSNSTNHNGFLYFGASDSTSGIQTTSDYNPTSQRILTAVRINGGKDARTNHYLDSLVLGFASTNYLTPKKIYNFGADSLIIKGNMGISASSSDSVLVRGSDNVVVLRAQSDLGGGLLSGTYTPTLTNVANVAASTAYSCQYSRVGTVVTVSGEVDIDPTTTLTLTQLGISLPIASNLTATNELGGTSADDLGTVARVAGDATNDRAEVRMTPTDVTNRRFSFTFTYRIL